MDKKGHYMVTHGCVNQKKTRGRKGQVTRAGNFDTIR
jgi:hypothetical protein